MKRIPIGAARDIAEKYGYDQVVIYARKVDEVGFIHGGEHMTTYGRNKVHCDVAARIGKTLQKFMGWNVADPPTQPDPAKEE
jgi:hypothetical protein